MYTVDVTNKTLINKAGNNLSLTKWQTEFLWLLEDAKGTFIPALSRKVICKAMGISDDSLRVNTHILTVKLKRNGFKGRFPFSRQETDLIWTF